METIPNLIYQDEILLHAAARKLPQPRECLGVPGAIALLCSAPSQCSRAAPRQCKRPHCQLQQTHRPSPEQQRGGAAKVPLTPMPTGLGAANDGLRPGAGSLWQVPVLTPRPSSPFRYRGMITPACLVGC